jgi:hypothetical protein
MGEQKSWQQLLKRAILRPCYNLLDLWFPFGETAKTDKYIFKSIRTIIYIVVIMCCELRNVYFPPFFLQYQKLCFSFFVSVNKTLLNWNMFSDTNCSKFAAIFRNLLDCNCQNLQKIDRLSDGLCNDWTYSVSLKLQRATLRMVSMAIITNRLSKARRQLVTQLHTYSPLTNVQALH